MALLFMQNFYLMLQFHCIYLFLAGTCHFYYCLALLYCLELLYIKNKGTWFLGHMDPPWSLSSTRPFTRWASPITRTSISNTFSGRFLLFESMGLYWAKIFLPETSAVGCIWCSRTWGICLILLNFLYGSPSSICCLFPCSLQSSQHQAEQTFNQASYKGFWFLSPSWSQSLML